MSDPRMHSRTKERPDIESFIPKSTPCHRGEALKEESKSDTTGNEATDNALPCISRNENEPLTIPKVLEFFKLASNRPEVTISVPPVRPKGGEVYLFIPESSNTTSKILQ